MKQNCYCCIWFAATVCTHLDHDIEQRDGTETCNDWRGFDGKNKL